MSSQPDTMPVVRQLCVALAALLFQGMEELGSGTLVQLLQQWLGETGARPDFMAVLLELLTIFPEEVNTAATPVSTSARAALDREVAACRALVLPFLQMLLSPGMSAQAGLSSLELPLRALQSWSGGREKKKKKKGKKGARSTAHARYIGCNSRHLLRCMSWRRRF
jgi:hypothetical protein